METRNRLLYDTALRILGAAEECGIRARLLGGLAFYASCGSARAEPLARPINDLDIIVPSKQALAFGRLLGGLEFVGDRRFNSVHGETRMLFENGDTQIDVFVGRFLQCHEIDLEGRIDRRALTIPLSDLLLTKLQIVELNRKDVLDILALLIDHPFASGDDDESIDLDRLVAVTRKDWGWYTTVSKNLDKVVAAAGGILPAEPCHVVRAGISSLSEVIDHSPKSLAWKFRDKIGARVTWYNLPEDKLEPAIP